MTKHFIKSLASRQLTGQTTTLSQFFKYEQESFFLAASQIAADYNTFFLTYIFSQPRVNEENVISETAQEYLLRTGYCVFIRLELWYKVQANLLTLAKEKKHYQLMTLEYDDFKWLHHFDGLTMTKARIHDQRVEGLETSLCQLNDSLKKFTQRYQGLITRHYHYYHDHIMLYENLQLIEAKAGQIDNLFKQQVRHNNPDDSPYNPCYNPCHDLLELTTPLISILKELTTPETLVDPVGYANLCEEQQSLYHQLPDEIIKIGQEIEHLKRLEVFHVNHEISSQLMGSFNKLVIHLNAITKPLPKLTFFSTATPLPVTKPILSLMKPYIPATYCPEIEQEKQTFIHCITQGSYTHLLACLGWDDVDLSTCHKGYSFDFLLNELPLKSTGDEQTYEHLHHLPFLLILMALDAKQAIKMIFEKEKVCQPFFIDLALICGANQTFCLLNQDKLNALQATTLLIKLYNFLAFSDHYNLGSDDSREEDLSQDGDYPTPSYSYNVHVNEQYRTEKLVNYQKIHQFLIQHGADLTLAKEAKSYFTHDWSINWGRKRQLLTQQDHALLQLYGSAEEAQEINLNFRLSSK